MGLSNGRTPPLGPSRQKHELSLDRHPALFWWARPLRSQRELDYSPILRTQYVNAFWICRRRRSRAAWRHRETSRRLSRWRCFRAHWAYWPCACVGPWQHPRRSGTSEAISANWLIRVPTSLLHSPCPPKSSPMTASPAGQLVGPDRTCGRW